MTGEISKGHTVKDSVGQAENLGGLLASKGSHWKLLRIVTL